MGLFKKASNKQMQLIFLFKSGNYEEIITMLDKGLIVFDNLDKNDISLLFEDALKTKNVNSLLVLFAGLDNKQKIEAIKCFNQSSILIPSNMIETNLKLFLKVSLEEELDFLLLEILKFISQNYGSYKREAQKIKEYLQNRKNDNSDYIMQMNELVNKCEYDRLYGKKGYFRYFANLDRVDKELQVKCFIEETRGAAYFEEFVVNTNCIDLIVHVLLASTLDNELKSIYLMELLFLDIDVNKDEIIDILLSFKDSKIEEELERECLFDMAGRITSVKLLSNYLMRGLSAKEFEQFLFRIVDYRVVLNTIRSLNLDKNVRELYLRTMLMINDPFCKNEILKELGEKSPEDLGDPFAEDTEDLSDPFAEKDDEKQKDLGISFDEAVNLNAVVGEIRDEEAKDAFKKDFDILGGTVVPEASSKEEDSNGPIVDDNFSLRDYLLSFPSLKEFRLFILKNDNAQEVYEELMNFNGEIEQSLLSEYLYVVFEVNKDQELAKDLIEDILILNDKGVCIKLMQNLNVIQQQDLIDWGLKIRNLEVLLMLACVTNCDGTLNLIELLFNMPNDYVHLTLALGLNEEALNYGLPTLLNTPNNYLKLLYKLYEMAMTSDEEQINIYLEKLRRCINLVFDLGKESIFEIGDRTVIQQILEVCDNNQRNVP